MLLASADSAAALSDHSTSRGQFATLRIEAHRHVFNESIDVHFLDHFVELLFGSMLRVNSTLRFDFRSVENVRSNGPREQNRLLGNLFMSPSPRLHDADHAPHEISRQIIHIHAIQQDFALGDFVQTAEKRGDRAFAGSRPADDPNILSWMGHDI